MFKEPNKNLTRRPRSPTSDDKNGVVVFGFNFCGRDYPMLRSKFFSFTRIVFLVLAWQSLSGVAKPCFAALPAGTQIDMNVLVVGTTVSAGTPDVQTAAVTSILDRVGVPYTLVTSQSGVLAALPTLEDATTNHAFFQGVIFAVSDVRMNPYISWGGPQATADAVRLAAYLFKYNVRVASAFTWPTDTGCLQLFGSTGITVNASGADALLTTAGRTALPYLKAGTSAANPLKLKNTYLYQATALPASGGTTPGVDVLPTGTTVTPWITYGGQPVSSVCQFTDTTGNTRQMLAINVNNAPYLTHTMALSYGLVQWITKGIHLGEVQTWLDAQNDDLFLADDEYPYTVLNDGKTYNFEAVTRNLLGLGPTPSPITCTATDPTTGAPCEYRMLGADLGNVVNWQNKLRSNAWAGAKTINNRTTSTLNTGGTDGVRLTLAYNGVGATLAAADQPCGSLCEPAWPNDTLTTAVNLDSSEFKWLNHTWDHQLLDPMAYTTTGTCASNAIDAKTEVCWNHKVKQVLGLSKYDKEAFVTPEISGLYNRNVLDAFAIFSATPALYLVSDTSKPTPPELTPGCTPPSPPTLVYPLPSANTGKYNCTALTATATRPTPRYVYEVPRYPVALFYLVTTPTEWTNAYNFFYGANHVLPTPSVPPFVDANGQARNQTYAEIVDYVSDTLLGYLLTYDSRPWMFHQANLRAYSGTRFLLGDLLEETLTKYNAMYQNQPIRSPRLKDIGIRMRNRMVYNQMNVKATLTPGQSIRITADTTRAAGLVNHADASQIVVPITGVAYGTTPGTGLANNPMTYGSGTAARTISYVNLTPTAAYSFTVPSAPAW
jgi:hypothetical protein